MILYIILGVAAVLAVGALVALIEEYGWVAGVLLGLLATVTLTLVSLLAAALLVGVTSLMPSNHTETTTTDLRALGSDSSVNGRHYFLGGGHSEGVRVLSYIQVNENGSFTANQVEAKYAQVWEYDEGEPKLVTHKQYADYWWLYPKEVGNGTRWEFHVPEGSVNSEFDVTP